MPHLHGSLCCSKAKNYETLCLVSPLLCDYHAYSLPKPTENHPLTEKDRKINIVSLGLQTAIYQRSYMGQIELEFFFLRLFLTV